MSNEKLMPTTLCSIFAAGLLSFCGVIVETALNVIFPTLVRIYDVDISTVQWLTTGYLLVLSLIIPLSVSLKRRFPLKRLFICANLSFTAGLLINGLAPFFWLALCGRLLQGIGTGLALPLMFNIILEQVPPAYLGRIMGVGMLITAIAPSIGPVYGGFLATHLTWECIFWFLLPLLFLSLFLGAKNITQQTPIAYTPIDTRSFISLSLGLVSLLLGLTKLGEHSSTPLEIWILFLLGFSSLYFFVHHSQKLVTPLLNLSILKKISFTGHLLSFCIFQSGALGLSFLIPLYVQLPLGESATLAGFLLFPGALIGALLAPISGYLLDRFGPAVPILSGASSTILSLSILSLKTETLTPTLILGAYIFFGIGMGLSMGNMMTNGIRALREEEKPSGNAMMNTLQQFSGATGTALVAAIVSLFQQTISGQGTLLGIHIAFCTLGAFAVIALFLLFKVTRK